MNLIVIISDTFRADNLTCYGNARVKTPNLDRLAEEGVVFMNCYADGLPTIPARRVFFTGRSIIPMEKYGGWTPIGEGIPTLSEVLQDAGYTTALYTDTHPYFEPGMDFHRGHTPRFPDTFDSWEWIRGQQTDAWRSGPRDRFDPKQHMPEHLWNEDYGQKMLQYLMNTQDIVHEEDYFCARVLRGAARWLERNRGNQPFCLWVDTFDPHEPWDAPKRFQRMYRDEYPYERYLFGYGVNREDIRAEDYPVLRALYAAEVTFLDMWIGEFLNRVADLGLMDDTIIVFSADHGTQLGEKGWVQKAPPAPLDSHDAQLPLLVRHPDGPSGRQMQPLVSATDFMPTFLDFLDIGERPPMDGKNFWDLVEGNEDLLHERVFIEFHNFAAVRDMKWHYYQNKNSEPTAARGVARGLYNLEKDPGETRDVGDAHPDVVRQQRALLEERLEMSLPS
jgi:arylsulfatase A-like enzyme